MRLRGHFDGRNIVLDQPVPPELKPNTPVDVLTLDAREEALREMEAFFKELWTRPATVGTSSTRRWTREELHDRGREGVS
jgi:hypothetical protein